MRKGHVRSQRKIAIYDPSGSGGITHYSYELATALAASDCAVTLITSSDYELRDVPKTFKTWYLFRRSLMNVVRDVLTNTRMIRSASEASNPDTIARPTSRPSLLDILRTLRRCWLVTKATLVLLFNGTEVVHVQWIADRFADLYFIRLLRLCGFKIVYTVHDLLPHDGDTPANREFFQRMYQQPDRLIVHSHDNKREMLELFDVESGRLLVIPHGAPARQTRRLIERTGADTGFSTDDNMSAHAARAALGLPLDVNVILFFGLIKQYKGLEYLLQAFDIIDSRVERVSLLIAGRIDDSDPEAYNRYSTMLSQYARRANVVVKSGYIPVDETIRYFSAADVVVLPYIKASQSGVLLTAYATGRPVVVTDTGSLPETVHHGSSGFVVPPKNTEALADAILAIVTDVELKKRMGAEASRLATTTYSWRHIGQLTRGVYDALVGDIATTRSGAE